MSLSNQTTDEIIADLRDGHPHFSETFVSRQADLLRKSQHHQQAIERIISACDNPGEARRIWQQHVPVGNASLALMRARRHHFMCILLAHGLLSRSQIKELEASDSDEK